MILSDIYLENIRSHNKTTVKFIEGINIITGNTGSGKSSILMSIEYALFGKIGEGKDEGKILLRRNAKDGKITIKIKDGEDRFEISRGLKRLNEAVRNDDAKNYIDKNENRVDLQNRASDINSYVNNILKIESENPLKMFETITYIKQDELKNLIFETGQYKQEYIDGLLQLNKYLSVYENMRELIARLKNEIDLDRKEIELSIDENEIIKTENKINESKNLIEDIKNSINNQNLVLENKILVKTQIENEIKLERSKKIKFEKISTETKLLEREKEKLKDEFKKTEEKIDGYNEKLTNFDEKRKYVIETTIKDIETKFSMKNEEVKKLYEKFYNLEYSYKKAVNDKENLIKEEKNELEKTSQLSNEENLLKNQINAAADIKNKEELKGRISEIQNIKKELETEMENSISKGICLLCGSKLGDISHITAEYEKRIKGYESYITKLSDIYENIKFSKNELEKQLEIIKMKLHSSNENLNTIRKNLSVIDLDKMNILCREADIKYKKSSEDLETILASLKEMREENKLLQEQEKITIELKNLNNRVIEINVSLLTCSKDIDSLHSELKEINFDEEQLKKSEENHNSISDDINKINYRITEFKKEIEMREKQITEEGLLLNELKIRMKKKEEITAKLTRKEELLKLLSNLREDIRSIREYIRLKFINEFRSLFKTRFEELRNETDYSIDIDNNYNVVISSGHEETDARTLSGGEKTSVAIAYRLALSSLASILGGVGKNELVVMDEPTSGLDKEDINALTNAITKIHDLKQIIIVTHEDSMKNIADNAPSLDGREV